MASTGFYKDKEVCKFCWYKLEINNKCAPWCDTERIYYSLAYLPKQVFKLFIRYGIWWG